jgi:DNA-directed RNA polymerase beta subunit
MVENYKEIIKAYFKEHQFGEANIKSFDEFLDKGMQKIIDEIGDIIPTIIPQEVENFVIRLKKIWVEKPTITEADGSKRPIFPSEARLRSLTYSAPIFLEVSAYVDDIQRESFTAMIGKIPIMTKSKYCHLYNMKKEELIKHGEDPDDYGGYFIINGNERIIISVEDLASNRLFIEKNETGPAKYEAKIYSEFGSYRIPHTIEQMNDGTFYITFTRFRRVPIISLIKALGIVKDQDIIKAIDNERTYDSILINLVDSTELKTEKDALEFLGKKIGMTQTEDIKIERAKEQLDRYLLPHLGTDENARTIKAYNLCKILKKFLRIIEDNLQLPDKDHYANKRVKLSGELLETLMRANIKNLVQDMLYNFQRLVKRGKFHSIRIIIRDELLTSNIKSALATGSWVAGRKGITQNMDKTNKLASFSHGDKIVSLLTSTQENFKARALHPTHWGKICPIETPEGTPIGLRKNKAILCEISQNEGQEDKIKKILESYGLRSIA